jgi:hypothetical protein
VVAIHFSDRAALRWVPYSLRDAHVPTEPLELDAPKLDQSAEASALDRNICPLWSDERPSECEAELLVFLLGQRDQSRPTTVAT